MSTMFKEIIGSLKESSGIINNEKISNITLMRHYYLSKKLIRHE